MATVKVNEIPTPKPPATYDILDLTEDEMELIVNLVGITSGHTAYKLYMQLACDKFVTGYFDADEFLCGYAYLRPENGK